MLFGKLPDEIFRPLSGSNRAIIEKVLKQLHQLFFNDENAEADAPHRDVVKNEIHQVLIMEENLTIADEEDSPGITFDTPAAAADYIFRRLVKTQWLELEEEGYNTFVIFNPSATLLLDALIGIEHHEKKCYSMVVLSVLSHLDTATYHAKERGMVFLDAVAQTRAFSNHLRGILYSLKEVQDNLAAIKDPRQVLANFFEMFVENILIADYKTLNSEDSPFRFRKDILTRLRHIEYSEDLFRPIIGHYMEHYTIPEEEATSRFSRDLAYIRRVFLGVDQRLDKIDSFRFRLEGRVWETVRFIDRTMPGVSSQFSKYVLQFGEQMSDPLATVPGPVRCLHIKPLSVFSIHNPHGKKEKPTSQALRTREISPEARQQREIVRAYMKARAYEPTRVIAFLNRQMGTRTTMSAAEFVVESVEDLVSFLLIRHLPRMQAQTRMKDRVFNVHREAAVVDTEWLSCPNFTVERIQNAD